MFIRSGAVMGDGRKSYSLVPVGLVSVDKCMVRRFLLEDIS